MSYLPAEDEHRGCIYRGGRPAWADRPRWPPASLGSIFLQRDDLPFVTFVPACSTSCTVQTLSYTPLLALLVLLFDAFALSHVHAPLLHVPPWISAKHCCPPPMLVFCMWPWWKLLEWHTIMHHGACMICLTRLPFSKNVLRLSTPLILKIKNKFRAMKELEHNFREVFKLLKTSVS
jgi:hypothetical protein